MTTTKSNRRSAKVKPTKPYPDFPLFPHATRRWAKKIRGKLYYFGPWDDPQGALQKYLDQKDDLHAGRTPRISADGFTVRDLCHRFLSAKRDLVDTGEIVQRTFLDYYAVCAKMVEVLEKNRLVSAVSADDFHRLRKRLSMTHGPVRLGNEIQRVRSVFKWAYDLGLIDKPVRFGPDFKRPPKQVIRKLRNGNGFRIFQADELRKMIEAAGIQLRAMILLGINCGFGNSDCANLPRKALDLDGGWIDYPRPKTGIPRRCPLWPETAAALRVAIANRPKPQNGSDAGLVFITKYGQSWAKANSDNPVSKETTKLLRILGIYRRPLGFYALRHTFETRGSDSWDQVAVDHIMGRARDDRASISRERISDERLRAVTDHVHKWLFGE
jgi:integrase